MTTIEMVKTKNEGLITSPLEFFTMIISILSKFSEFRNLNNFRVLLGDSLRVFCSAINRYQLIGEEISN